MPRTPAAPKKAVLNVEEVAARLGIGVNRVYELVNAGLLPHFRIGRRVLIGEAELGEWVSQQSRQRASLLQPPADPITAYGVRPLRTSA